MDESDANDSQKAGGNEGVGTRERMCVCVCVSASVSVCVCERVHGKDFNSYKNRIKGHVSLSLGQIKPRNFYSVIYE